MTAKGYCTRAQVAAYLGRTFTAAQDTECDLLIESAEIVIDRYTGRAWGVATITGEQHLVEGGFVTLRNRPITAITSLTAEAYPHVNEPSTTLVSLADYELFSATDGLLYLGLGYEGYLVTVSYTAPTTIPANVRDATKLLVASWMRPPLDGLTDDVQGYSVPGEISVTYRDGAPTGGSLPAEVIALLGRRLVVV